MRRGKCDQWHWDDNAQPSGKKPRRLRLGSHHEAFFLAACQASEEETNADKVDERLALLTRRL